MAITGETPGPVGRQGARGVFANAGVMLIGKTANAIFNLAYVAVTARLLGASAFGLVVLINAFASAIGEIVQFQSWQVVLHYGSASTTPDARRDLQRVIRFALMLDIVSGVGGAGFAMLIAIFAGRILGWPPGAEREAIPYLTSVLFMMQATPTGILRLFGRFDILSAHSSVTALTRLVAVCIVWLWRGGLIDCMIAWYVGNVASWLFLYACSFREMARRDMLGGFSWFGGSLTAGLPGVWRFAWATNFRGTLELVFTQAGVLLVGALVSPAAAGLFRIAWQVANAATGLVRIVVDTLYPELARLRIRQDHQAVRSVVLRVCAACGATGVFLFVVVLAWGGPFLALLMGAPFSRAGPILTWLFAAVMVGAWTMPLEALLISTGRAVTALRIRLVAAAAYLVMIGPLVKAFGLQGAGFASLAASVPLAVGLILSVAPLSWRRATSVVAGPPGATDLGLQPAETRSRSGD